LHLCMQSITIFSFEFSALIPLRYFYLKQYMLSSAILFIYLFIYYQFSQVRLCFFLTLAREEIKHMIDNVLLFICTS